MTRKDIDAFWSRCSAGTRMTCLVNTYNHKAPGSTGVITKPGKSSMRLTRDTGEHFWITPPRNVSDYREVTSDTVTYSLGDDHTATWRIDS